MNIRIFTHSTTRIFNYSQIQKIKKMHSLFTPTVYDGIVARIHTVTPADERQWGKMNAAQMLEHCARPFEATAGRSKPKRVFMGYIIAPFLKKSYFDGSDFAKNSPTIGDFMVNDDVDFETSKAYLLRNMAEFHAGGAEKCTTHPHAFFGKLTPEQWAIGMYKHLDHHLRQFGR
jgi:hypothetical protein